MFQPSSTFSSFSTNDIEAAKAFYSQTLGCETTATSEGGLEIHLPGGSVFVYPKGDQHVPATFTVLNFAVPDIDEAVDALTAKGVVFEHYTGDIATDDKGIMRGKAAGMGPDIAWFKDPAGNIISVLSD